MPHGRRGGTDIYWRTWGAGAPELLLIHCTLAHSGAWAGVVQHLDRPALAFDLPSHGRSAPRDPASDYQTQSLAVARDFLRPAPMDVIGHSFGATVALRLALEQPERVRRLVLIEPVLFAACRGSEAFDAYVEELQGFGAAIERGDRHGAARWFTEVWGTGVGWIDLRAEQQHALAEQIELIPAQNAALFEDSGGLLAPGRLEAFDTPVLLVEGAASPPVIGAIAQALAARLPDVERCVIDGAGHMLPITHAAETAALVAPFLSRS